MDSSSSDDATEERQDSPPAKKRKLGLCDEQILKVHDDDGEGDSNSNEPSEETNSESANFPASSSGSTNSKPKTKSTADFSKMKIIKVVQNKGYSIDFLAVQEGMSGTFSVRMKKTPFDDKKVNEIMKGATNISQLINNDAFGSFTVALPSDMNRAHVSFNHSFTKSPFQKTKLTNLVVVDETAEIYETVTKPFIENRNPKQKRWIYNILNGVREADRVILRDRDPETGFVLLPDLKWSGEQLSDLYCQAIVNRTDLPSIRDLTGDCLPLLRNIRDEGTSAICSRYGIAPGRLCVYLHYIPSYYHLHVHFRELNFCDEDTKYGRIHPLVTVISNLEVDPLYYRKCTLSVVVLQNHLHPLGRLIKSGKSPAESTRSGTTINSRQNLANKQPNFNITVPCKRKRSAKAKNNFAGKNAALQHVSFSSDTASERGIVPNSSGKSGQMDNESIKPNASKPIEFGESSGLTGNSYRKTSLDFIAGKEKTRKPVMLS